MRKNVSFCIHPHSIERSTATCLRNDAVNDREVFMKGIDASYAYEGYMEFVTSEIEA